MRWNIIYFRDVSWMKNKFEMLFQITRNLKISQSIFAKLCFLLERCEQYFQFHWENNSPSFFNQLISPLDISITKIFCEDSFRRISSTFDRQQTFIFHSSVNWFLNLKNVDSSIENVDRVWESLSLSLIWSPCIDYFQRVYSAIFSRIIAISGNASSVMRLRRV